jgi:hypothetical protein
VLPMSPHSRHAPRNCDLPSLGAESAPSVITMPDPRPLPQAMRAMTRATDHADVVSGRSRHATAIESTTGTATIIRPRVSISQPPGHMKATSRAAAPAKISDVVAAERPMWSAHSGSRLVRSERLMPRMTTAVPRVASTRRWDAMTVHTPRCPLALAAARFSSPTSGIVAASNEAATDIAAPSQNTLVRSVSLISPAPTSGPMSTPTR